MAQLPIYNDNTAPQLPSDIGSEAVVSAARRVGAFASQSKGDVAAGAAALGRSVGGLLQQRETDQANQEISQGHVALSQMQANHVSLWNQTGSETDPNQLAAAGQAFTNNVLNPDGQAFVDGFKTPGGREWAQKAVGEYQGHMIQRVAADATTAAGAAAISNASQTLNILSNTALKDPSTFDQSLSIWKTGIDALSQNPRLDAAQRAELSKLTDHGAETLAAASVKGAIEANPDAGLALLHSGKFDQYLSGANATALDTYSRTISRANRAQAKADDMDQRQKDKDAFNQTGAQIAASVIDPDTGGIRLPDNYYENVIRHSQMPGANEGSIQSQLSFGKSIQAEAAKGVPTPTDRGTYNDFRNRMFLGEDDPQQLSIQQVMQAKADGRLDKDDYSFFVSAVGAGVKNPQMVDDEKQLQNFFKSGNNGLGTTNPQNHYMFEREKTNQFLSGRAAGVPTRDLLDPQNKSFIGFATPEQLSSAAIQPVQQATPAVGMQQAMSKAVDVATQVENLGRNNDPEEVNDILKAGGVNIDVRDSAWCAGLVNSALEQAGLQGTGNQTAASFKGWGFPVDAATVQKGDVFYVPSEGYTGHVGFTTGQTRPGPNGQLQVQVVSSHKQGAAENPGGIEWRLAQGMVFRRAKPPLEQIITPGVGSRIWNYLSGTGNDQTTQQPGDGNEGDE